MTLGWSDLPWIFDPTHTCPCCNRRGGNLLSLAYDCPDVLPMTQREKRANAMLCASEGDVLTEDFCRMQKYRFVRCMLELPLQGRPECLYLGVWGTLSQANFDAYVERFDARSTHELPPMSSWLSNAVPPGTSLPIACTMQTRSEGLRPVLQPQEDGPLRDWHECGIAPNDLVMLLEAYGHTPLKRH